MDLHPRPTAHAPPTPPCSSPLSLQRPSSPPPAPGVRPTRRCLPLSRRRRSKSRRCKRLQALRDRRCKSTRGDMPPLWGCWVPHSQRLSSRVPVACVLCTGAPWLHSGCRVHLLVRHPDHLPPLFSLGSALCFGGPPALAPFWPPVAPVSEGSFRPRRIKSIATRFGLQSEFVMVECLFA